MNQRDQPIREQAIGPDGLTRRDRDLIRDVLARCPDVRRVTLFGSRAMGTFGRGSDIDLALEGPDLDARTLTRIATELEDSDLPYKVDLLLRDDQLEPKLEAHIRRHGKPFGWEPTTVGNHINVMHGFTFKSVLELQDEAILLVEDGNHGEYRPRTDEFGQGDYAFIRAADMNDGRVLFASAEKINDNAMARIRKGVGHGGDVLFSHKGTVGKVALVPLDAPPFVCSPQTTFWRTLDEERLDRRYLYSFMRSRAFIEQWAARCNETDMAAYVSLTAQRQLKIALPEIAEQRHIAGVLGALDDKIEQSRRTAQALERLARAIFRAWFVDFEPVKAKAAGATAFPSMPQPVFDALPTRFVDSAIGPVPEGWEVQAIGDVVTAKGGGTPSTTNSDYWDGGEHCWATPKDMSRLSHPVLLDTERRITDAGVNNISSGILPVGTVLMSSRAPIGYLAIAGVPTAINQGFIAMVCDGPLPPTYVLNWAFTSMDAIKAHASGTTFPEISKKNFRPLLVVLPTDDVIAAYQQTADPLFDLLTACVKENVQLAQMRDYLLPKLVSGEIRVDVGCDNRRKSQTNKSIG